MDAEPDHQLRGPSVAGEGTIRALAEAAFVGLPLRDLIRTRDPVERQLLLAVQAEGVNVLNDTLTNLARKIVEEYSKAQERGKKKGA